MGEDKQVLLLVNLDVAKYELIWTTDLEKKWTTIN